MPRMRKAIPIISKHTDYKIRTISKLPSCTNGTVRFLPLSSMNVSYLVLKEVLALHKIQKLLTADSLQVIFLEIAISVVHYHWALCSKAALVCNSQSAVTRLSTFPRC